MKAQTAFLLVLMAVGVGEWCSRAPKTTQYQVITVANPHAGDDRMTAMFDAAASNKPYADPNYTREIHVRLDLTTGTACVLDADATVLNGRGVPTCR